MTKGISNSVHYIMMNPEMRTEGGGNGGIICLTSARERGAGLWRKALTGSHKQVAASLSRGPAVIMREGGVAGGGTGGTGSSSFPPLAGKNKSQLESSGAWVPL